MEWTCVHVRARSEETGRVRACKRYLCCQVHVDSSIPFSIFACVREREEGGKREREREREKRGIEKETVRNTQALAIRLRLRHAVIRDCRITYICV
jgi:hypothetical protein